jgi:hypothetical protein
MLRSRCSPFRFNDWARRAFAVDGRSLAAFRIAIGAVVCSDAILRTRDFGVMFTPNGMFPLSALGTFLSAPGVWSLATAIDASWWSSLMLILEGLAGAALAVGAGTRIATVAAWVAVVSVLRRTGPATNAGDLWLACLLFWGMFLPLGATWSLDAFFSGGRPGQRRGDARSQTAETTAAGRAADPRPPRAVLSAGSAALVLQIVAVYLASGLSKCNASWLSGDAIARVLSVHDHGTRWGAAVGSSPWLTRPATWAVLLVEIVGPLLLLAVPRPRVRLAVAAVFIVFHASIAILMSVGLFAFVGMAAWLAILPASAWPAAKSPTVSPAMRPAEGPASGTFGLAWQWCCVAAGCLAMASLVHHNGPWRRLPLPRSLAAAINACCLDQDWGMFGEVFPQEQWVYARGELADGRVVDVLRGGRPMESVRPTDGFGSLPHHRWHKLFWEMPRPALRIFSPSIAATLARRWNETHDAQSRLRSLEIRYARQAAAEADGEFHELLLATWPPRDGAGRGNLDRLLEEQQWPSRDRVSTAGTDASRAATAAPR